MGEGYELVIAGVHRRLLCPWSVRCSDACGVTYIIITVHWESLAASAWHTKEEYPRYIHMIY